MSDLTGLKTSLQDSCFLHLLGGGVQADKDNNEMNESHVNLYLNKLQGIQKM